MKIISKRIKCKKVGRKRNTKQKANKYNGLIRNYNKDTKCCFVCYKSISVNDKPYYGKVPFIIKNNMYTECKRLCSICSKAVYKYHITVNKMRIENASSLLEYKCIAANSRINGAGMGLYPIEDIKKGDVISLYNGEREEFNLNKYKNNSYIIKSGKSMINGDPNIVKFDLRKLAAYSNDLSLSENSNKNIKNNAHFRSMDSMGMGVQLVADRNISAYEEIYAKYVYK